MQLFSDKNIAQFYQKIHHQNEGELLIYNSHFEFLRRNTPIQDYKNKPNQFNLIYYDAFGPALQPEMWTKEIFENLFTILKPDGILVTYCAKGDVKRNLKEAGFSVEGLPGPPGKREVTRAIK
jgi:tRNA U34 5-methylaminomethyl-2-thiouridine-forming methyltransferase MnmC